MIDIAERNGLVVWGGGMGRFSMPNVDGNYRIPPVIEKLTMFVALQGGIENEMLFCAYSLTDCIPFPNIEKEIREAFPAATFNLTIKSEVNIWK